MIYHGDCLEVLRTLPDCSVDAVVTDPPYGLSFMGKKWDYDVPSVEVWAECLRVLKPGGHLLAFAGTRTQHRMAVRIEDAGFEIRDMIAWVYGSGFPKSRDISKDMDRAAGEKREVVGQIAAPGMARANVDQGAQNRNVYTFDKLGAPITDAARQWQGWGTALKPSLEPVTVARKPLIGTVAANVLAHGTGALNIDGCRVEGTEDTARPQGKDIKGGNWSGDGVQSELTTGGGTGRWPANLIHDGSDEVVGLFPGEGDKSAARFMYCAKASKKDRDEGLEGFEKRSPSMKTGRKENTVGLVGDPDNKGQTANPYANGGGKVGNHHPTVKPTNLMRYLCRLITPPGGTVLDPFMGSGSTGKAAMLEGFQFIGIEREAEYVEISKARIASAQAKPKQEDLF